jgi:hypothetical protein
MPRIKKKFYLVVPVGYSNSIEDYEKGILDKLISNNPASYYKNALDEYKILNDHIKHGGSLVNEKYFFDNIEKIAAYKYYKGLELIYNYCRNVLKDRLPVEVERRFFKVGGERGIWGNHTCSKVACKYAKYVVRGRLPEEYEKHCGNANYISFLESKKVDIDPLLINNSALAWHFYRYNFYVSEDVHNAMIAKSMIGDYMAKIYFKQRKRDDKLIKNRLKILDPSKTIGDLVKDL